MAELRQTAERHDHDALVDALIDLERGDRLEEHLGAAVLGLEADPRQRAFGRWLLRLLRRVGLLALPGLHAAVLAFGVLPLPERGARETRSNHEGRERATHERIVEGAAPRRK